MSDIPAFLALGLMVVAVVGAMFIFSDDEMPDYTPPGGRHEE
jgi:hypothetical protein